MNGTPPRHPRRPGLIYRWMMAFIGLFDRWLHLSCRSFIELASEKHERPLRRGERIRQGFHRLICRICRVQERRLDQLRRLAREAAEDDAVLDAELSPAARERIGRAVAAAAERSSSEGGEPEA
jgi:hypothetical protein